MANAGRVAIVPKGDWNANVEYKRLDAVAYNNTLYIAKKAVPIGTMPTDTEYYMKCIVGGAGAIATTEDAGIVKAGEDINVDDTGEMSLKTDFTVQEELAELTGDEDRKTFFGKIAKAISDFIAHKTLKATASVLGHVKISNSAAITTEGEYALDAVEKNASIDGTMAHDIAANAAAIEDVNDNLENAYGKIESYGSYTPSATYKSESICTITANKKGKMLILANISVHTSRFMYLRNTTKAVNLSNVNFGNGINCILAVAQVDDGDVITLNSQFTATTELNYSVQAFYIV